MPCLDLPEIDQRILAAVLFGGPTVPDVQKHTRGEISCARIARVLDGLVRTGYLHRLANGRYVVRSLDGAQ